ncbi:MAG TPA: aryl-sulfate sulfotransferase, partial [Acidimicrobiales bacterium]|nr:aryl-sulfate sulfotransferase [Acidimicrobiales bacterium]
MTTAAAASTTAAVPLTISTVTVTPNPNSTLSASLSFTTSAPATIDLQITGPGSDRVEHAQTEPSTDHTIPALGMRASSTYTLTVSATDANGQKAAAAPVTFTTGALPTEIPKLLVKSNPAQMAPGVTLFPITLRAAPAPVAGQPPPMLGLLVAVDADGQVVWYHQAPEPIGDARMLDNGDILYEYNDMGAREIDVLGNVVHEWAGRLELGRLATDQYGRTIAGPNAIPVDVDSMHHEIHPMPDGNLITLSTELKQVSGFSHPMCGETPDKFTGTYQLISDIVVEFAPDTGKVVHEWHLADYFLPQTNPADSNICPFAPAFAVPVFMYTSFGDVKDWTHANAVVFDEKRNALLVSSRHLNAVLAIRYADDANGKSGDLIWRLGPGGDLTLTGSGELQYHQHAVEVQDDGSLLMYDNGNDRPGTDINSPDVSQHPYSRAVQFSLDDGLKTVTQKWEFRSTIDGRQLFTFFVG